MISAGTRQLPYAITGLSTLIGRVMSIGEWAEKARIPHRSGTGIMTGELIERVIGVAAKSWDPDMFRDIGRVIGVAGDAIRSAGLRPDQIDALIVMTSAPYEIMLDQDAFRIARELGLPDDVAPIQAGTGCAGLARAAVLAARLDAMNVLVVTYNAPSVITGVPGEGLSSLYRENQVHPLARSLWSSPGIFSDGAAALVLSRQAKSAGFVLYSRDSLSFGDEPGFSDPLIHYLGGGINHPVGTADSAGLSCFGMNGPAVKRYYTKGMMLNHDALNGVLPGYADQVRRIYTHQASPALVREFARLAGLPPSKAPSNARQYGNLVTVSTAKMLHDDLYRGDVVGGDLVCVSVVGAGPERGAFVLPVRVGSVPEPGGARTALSGAAA